MGYDFVTNKCVHACGCDFEGDEEDFVACDICGKLTCKTCAVDHINDNWHGSGIRVCNDCDTDGKAVDQLINWLDQQDAKVYQLTQEKKRLCDTLRLCRSTLQKIEGLAATIMFGRTYPKIMSLAANVKTQARIVLLSVYRKGHKHGNRKPI